MTDIADLDATAQAELVHRGEASPVELVDAAIERVQKLNGELNAVVHERFEKARSEAKAWTDRAGEDVAFRGVPFVHKDLDGFTAGDPFGGGGRFLRQAGFVAPHDSFLAATMKAAGFVLVGRTNTPELGLQPTTEPDANGPTRNPWDTTRSPGGSSGGSAAAVASRMVPVGHGGDGGGSIRIPASMCGLVGLKPSRGRISLGPDGEHWDGWVTWFVLTRSVRDTASLLDLLSSPMPGDPYAAPAPVRPYADEVGADAGRLRIGVCAVVPNGTTELHTDCVDAAERAGQLLESLGHQVEAAYPSAMAEPEVTEHFLAMFSTFAAFDLEEWSAMAGRAPTPEDVEPMTWALVEHARTISSTQYLASKQWLQRFTRRMAEWWQDFDVLVTPTLGEPPPKLGELKSPPDNPLQAMFRAAPLVPFTPMFNITGQPAISLPLHWNEDGLPIGVHLVGAYGREEILLRVAAQLEHAHPWADRHPPVRA